MKIIYVVVFAVFLSLLWQLLIPGPRVAVDHPYWPTEALTTFLSLPQSWREMLSNGLGLDAMSILWVWPVMFAHGLLSTFGLSFESLTYILGVIPILVFGFLGTGKLLGSFGLNKYATFMGQLFYLGNTYVLLLVDGGQLLIGVAYSLLPLSFYLYRGALKSANLKTFFLFCISVLLISIFDIRFLYLLGILSLVYVIYEVLFAIMAKDYGSIRKIIRSNIKILVFVGIIFVGFHAYWIFPAVTIKFSTLPAGYSRPQQVDFLSFSTVGHALLSLQPHWFSNVFGRISPLRPEFVLIPILVFLAPILKRRNKEIGFWLIISMVGVFLGKGAQDPLPNIYQWFFAHIPGFVLFRDPTKFYSLISLGFAVLIAISLDRIFSLRYLGKPLIQKAVFGLVIIYLVWLANPIYLGKMTGMFSRPAYLDEYQRLNELLRQDLNFGRVLWLPTRPPLGLTTPIHPSVEAIYLTEKRPFAVGALGSYETLNFLREASYSGELMDVSGVKYIAYPPLDPRRDDMHPDNVRYYSKFLNQLGGLPWISEIVKDSPIPLLKTDKHQEMFFLVNNIWWMVGSDDIYKTVDPAQLSLSKNAFIFPEERGGLGTRINEIPEAKIVLNKKGLIDLAATFLTDQNLIFPASFLKPDPDESGWWKRETADTVKWKEFLNTKYGIVNQDFDFGGGWSVSEGEHQLNIRIEKKLDSQVLLARVLESSRSGELSFFEDDKLIGQITTKRSGDNVRWFEIGRLGSGNDISIISAGEINVVNALGLVDQNIWEEYKQRALNLQSDNRIFNLDTNLNSSTSVKLEFEQIGPAKYQIKVSGLGKPGFLVFSQNFNDLWVSGDKKSLPVYSLLNGFRIESDGQFIVEFYPQRYVYVGTVISGFTIFVLLGLLLFTSVSSLLQSKKI